MLVILEGPDGSGKTTVKEALVKSGGYTELSYVPVDWPDQYECWEKLFKACRNDDYVMDRCFISELMYRPVLQDREPNISLKDFVRLLEILEYDIKTCIVFCNTKNSFDLAQKRGETFITDENSHKQIAQMYTLFKEILETFTNIPVLKYDFTEHTGEQLIDKLNDIFRH